MIGFFLFFVILCFLLKQYKKSISNSINTSMFHRRNKLISELLEEVNLLDVQIEALEENHKENIDIIRKKHILELEKIKSKEFEDPQLNHKEYFNIVKTVFNESISKISSN